MIQKNNYIKLSGKKIAFNNSIFKVLYARNIQIYHENNSCMFQKYYLLKFYEV